MKDEYARFRRYDTAKRIALLLIIMYAIVVLKNPESREVLPNLEQCFDFYLKLIRTLSGI